MATHSAPETATARRHTRREWWRDAVVYQVYPRSFADGNGDGVGDLAGVRSRLPYLLRLGVDALWFTPWYASPLRDGGYDVSDYRAVHPLFGTLEEAERLIADAARLGLRTIVDVVPNHVSRDHRWFREAVAAGPGGRARERFHFRPGLGPDGGLPPNDWQSEFGGPAWTRLTDQDGTPEDWYLHLFSPDQPDLDWSHPEVRAEHEDVLRFWFDRGVAGVRVDSATLLVKDPSLAPLSAGADPHPYHDREEVHEIYRSWRSVADSQEPPRMLVGEMWLDDPDRLARYLRPDELHTAFNLAYLSAPWDAAALRSCVEATCRAHAAVDAPPTWVLGNHDTTRVATRYGRADTSFDFTTMAHGGPGDLALGTRRARAAALLTLALPGSVYLYQGEELGLPEVEDLPADRRHDPMRLGADSGNPGRDGCRVPLPWEGDAPPYGFCADGVEPWLPQPGDWARLSVAAQDGTAGSTLELYRAALRLRRACRSPAATEQPAPRWLPAPPDVLAFRYGGLECRTNLGSRPVSLETDRQVLLASAPSEDGVLPPDTSVWLRAPDGPAVGPSPTGTLIAGGRSDA
ncbi:glycoside hydrolase family 13 protein [Streptomyces alkaliterrae]|uniref:glycoside hydrolase family 13 protein n=1 Tax=Streptomyces alkaliterrae TaxID=2213162 RepID=UPI002B20EC10|nr:glycoside hydrolase family 13 protein [Streptomyces alkaliterrae]